MAVGESYSVAYQLHERETVKQLEVVDGTLIFDSGKATNWQGGSEGYSIAITVPADAALENLTMYSTAGNISLNGIACGVADLSSVSGGFQLDNVEADEVKLLTGSGEVNTSGVKCGLIDVVTTDTNMNLDGEFANIVAESSSGVITVAGSVAENVTATTTTGAIYLKAPVSSIEAETISGSVYLGEAKQGNTYSVSGGAPSANLKTGSATITIEA